MTNGTCLLCFAVNSRNFEINATHLQVIYEKLTNLKVLNESVSICYICSWRLQQCYKLQQFTKITHAEGLQNNGNEIIKRESKCTLGKSVPCISVMEPEKLEANIKEENESDIYQKEYILQNLDYFLEVKVEEESEDCQNSGFTSDKPHKDISNYESKEEDVKAVLEHEGGQVNLEYFLEIIVEEDASDTLKSDDGDIPNDNISNQECGKKYVSKRKSVQKNVEFNVKGNSLLSNGEDMSHNYSQEDLKNSQGGKINNKRGFKQENVPQSGVRVRKFKHPSRRKKFSCDVCSQAFSQRSHLVGHKRTHTGEKPYICDVCHQTFAQKSHLVGHNRIHTGEKPYTCDVCKQTFAHSSHLVEHKRTHTGEKPYSCDICEQTFSRSSNLKTHKRTHTGDKPYTCDICLKTFTRSSNLKTHKRTHTGDKPYNCGLCSKTFSRSSHLIRHIKTHTGEKPYSCDICEKSFFDSCILKKHMRSHTGDKPYSCDICHQAFSQSSHVITHKRIHTGDKPYSCDICLQTFTQGSTLNKHKKTHYPQWVTFPLLNESFTK